MEFLRSAKILSLLTLTSRVLGLFRDMVTTAVLNAFLCDALLLAWTIPNVFRSLFGEGALSSAFIPAFSRVLEKEGIEKAFLLARRVITCMGLLLLSLVVVLLLLTWILPVSWMLPLFGNDAVKLEETLALARILLPYLAMVCIIAQFQGVLNSLKEFFIPAVSPVILNVVWIAAAVAAGFMAFEVESSRARFIAAGIMVGGGFQVLIFLKALRSRAFPLRPTLNLKDAQFRQVMATTVPMVLGVSAVQLNVLVDRGVASALIPHDGGVTHLFVGNRMMQFPLALIGVALTTAVFPLLSRLSAAGDREGVKENLNGALRINFFLSVPAAAGLLILAHPVIVLLFQRGEYDPDRAHATALALLGYAAGIPFLSSSMLLSRAFFAMGHWRQPLLVGVSLVGVNAMLDLILVGPYAEAGISAATSICAILQASILFFLFRRLIGHMGGRALMRGLLGTLALTALLAGAVGVVLWLLGPAGAEDALTVKAARVIFPIAMGLVVYLLPAGWICSFEWRKMMEAFFQRRPATD